MSFRTTQIPANFKANARHWEMAQVCKLDLVQELAKFTEFHRIKGTYLLDWDEALRRWLHKAHEYSVGGKA